MSRQKLNPWKAGWRAHGLVLLWIVFAGLVIGRSGLLAAGLWVVPVSEIPVLFIAFWINIHFHKQRVHQRSGPEER